MVTSGEDFEFFKVYLPKSSSKQMCIPPVPAACIIRYFKQSVPNKATLKDFTGRVWDVVLDKVDDGLAITKGWEDFAFQHSLVYGDFLVFTYDGNSHFDVVIFGKNGCKKDAAVKMEEQEDVEEEDSEEADVKPIVRMRACKQKHSVGAVPSQHGSTRKFARISQERLSDGFIKPSNPYFVKLMTRSLSYQLTICAKAVRCHGINLMGELVLHGQNEKTWSARLDHRSDGRMVLTTGWIVFYKNNKLVNGDECLFEFILEKGNRCRHIHVQIVRAKPALHKTVRKIRMVKPETS